VFCEEAYVVVVVVFIPSRNQIIKFFDKSNERSNNNVGEKDMSVERSIANSAKHLLNLLCSTAYNL